MAAHSFDETDYTGYADLTDDDLADWREHDDYPVQEEPNCGACADSGYVASRWPRWLRWFRPNHSWNCPWCNPTRLDRILDTAMRPVWRARYHIHRVSGRGKYDDEAPF